MGAGEGDAGQSAAAGTLLEILTLLFISSGPRSCRRPGGHRSGTARPVPHPEDIAGQGGVPGEAGGTTGHCLSLGDPGGTGRGFQGPQVTSVACGFWAMDGDELLWGVGLEQEFSFLGLRPVALGQGGGDREQVSSEQSGDTSLTGRGGYPNALNNLL